MHIAFEVAMLGFKMCLGNSLFDFMFSKFACYVENDSITTQDDGFTPSTIVTQSYVQTITEINSGVTPNDKNFFYYKRHISVSENWFPR